MVHIQTVVFTCTSMMFNRGELLWCVIGIVSITSSRHSLVNIIMLFFMNFDEYSIYMISNYIILMTVCHKFCKLCIFKILIRNSCNIVRYSSRWEKSIFGFFTLRCCNLFNIFYCHIAVKNTQMKMSN